MPTLSKALRIGLPLGTATTATILTACLVCLKNDDFDKEKELQDQELKDFVEPVQEFEEEEILEAKDESKGELGEESEDDKKKGDSEKEEDIDEKHREKTNDKGNIEEKNFNINNFIEKLKELPRKAWNSVTKKFEEVKETVKKAFGKDKKDPLSEDKASFPNSLDSNSGDSIQDQPEIAGKTQLDQENAFDDGGATQLNAIGEEQEVAKTKPQSESENVLSPSEEEEARSEDISEESASEKNGPKETQPKEGAGSAHENEKEVLQRDTNEREAVAKEAQPEQESSSISEVASGMQDQSRASGIQEQLDEGDQERGLKDGVAGGNSDNYSEDTIKQLQGFDVELTRLEVELGDLIN